MRHWAGVVVGLLALIMAGITFFNLGEIGSQQRTEAPREATFLAPVQQAGSVLAIEVSNLADHWSLIGTLTYAWPALLALVVFIAVPIIEKSLLKRARSPLVWLLLSWAALRSPNGLVPFLLILAAFLLLHV